LAKKRRRKETTAPAARTGVLAAAAAATLAVILAGTALVVDTEAAAAFDAPKRLIALVGTALAAALTFSLRDRDPAMAPLSCPPAARRGALWLTAAALLLTLVAAVASPRREIALGATRALGLYALLLPLGASRAVERGKTWLAATFLGATAVNSVVSILESRGLFRPFALETFGERQETGAYAGNVGYLAITVALGAVLALGVVLTSRRPPLRIAAGGALALFAATLLVNLNLTALTSALAGVGVLLVLVHGRRAAVPIAAAVLAAAIGVAGYAPLRHRAREVASAGRSGDWDALVSFRGGAWASAIEMSRDRPLVGYGPGPFAAENVPHRLAAEIRARRRFVAPLVTSSYAEAHCDYLQVFSEAGVPAGLAVLGAVACLFAAAGAAAWRTKAPELVLLVSVLAAGATAALTWFPLQRPVIAVPLLLAAGRAWRLSARNRPPDAEEAA
jgi:O-antigen ligase